MKQMITEMKMKFENTSSNNKNRKPDYLDFDGDDNESESMVDALDDKKEAAWKKFQQEKYVTNKTINVARQDFEKEYAKTESANSNIDEESGTGGIAGYQTPRAFSKNEKPKNKIKYPGVAEAMELRLEKLIEGYRTYATSDPKKSPETKVNQTIIEVSKKLREIEEAVRNASRLKEESGVTREGYKKRTNNALSTISERLVKISERVRNLMQ
jgi:hypothetical protein